MDMVGQTFKTNKSREEIKTNHCEPIESSRWKGNGKQTMGKKTKREKR